MLVKCVKYLNIRDMEMDNSYFIKKGALYPVLAISQSSAIKETSYYIQGSENNNYFPAWVNAKQFEIIEDQVYSEWQVIPYLNNGIKSIELVPKVWVENEPWFTDALIEEESQAIELFKSERNKMLEEWGYLDKYLTLEDK